MRKFIFLLRIGLVLMSWPALAENSAQKTKTKNPGYAFRYISTFPTIGESLTHLQTMGLVGADDRRAIGKELKARGIDESLILSKCTVKNKKVTCGKGKMSITNDGLLMTSSGRILRFDSNSTLSLVFAKTLQALENKNTSLFRKVFLNEAFAFDLQSLQDNATLAIGTGLVWITLGPGSAAGSAVMGTIGLLTEAILSPLRALKEGRVQCSIPRGEFEITGIDRLDFAAIQKIYASSPNKLEGIAGGDIIDKSFETARQFLSRSVQIRDRQIKIPDSELKQILGADTTCTPENTEKVQAAFRGNLSTTELGIERMVAENTREPGKPTVSPGSR